jgi:hypothetical protein
MAVRCGTTSQTAYYDVLNEACDGSLAKQFPVTNVEWRAAGNMCLETVNGRILLAVCNGSKNQLWTFFDAYSATSLAYNQIHSVGTGLRVSTQTGFVRKGDDLVLATCSQTVRGTTGSADMAHGGAACPSHSLRERRREPALASGEGRPRGSESSRDVKMTAPDAANGRLRTIDH